MRLLTAMKTTDNSSISKSHLSGNSKYILVLVACSVLFYLKSSYNYLHIIENIAVQPILINQPTAITHRENRSLVSLQDPPQIGKARVLMGIFCRNIVDKEYQEMFRLLFDLNPLVCSLGKYEQDLLQGTESCCQLIYTFVIGGNEDTLDGPTELLDDHIPILLEKGDDYVVLNIQENMNSGKSQTWFYFASTIMDNKPKLNFDYVGKMDTDSMPYLDKYFDFADNHLPPSPYNLRTMVGIFTDKAWWKTKSRINERFFSEHYAGYSNGNEVGVHLYPGGPWYILSKDLVSGVVAVARLSASGSSAKYVYSEGIEDHDIAAMAYISAEGKPMNLVQLSESSGFWRHGVKIKRIGWKDIWTNEINRTKVALSLSDTGSINVDATITTSRWWYQNY
jgi:hypothetical protein